MTREDAIYCMESYIDDDSYEHCTSCPYYGKHKIDENTYVCESSKAHRMAVKALSEQRTEQDVLDKIRAEIEPKCDRINSLASVLPYAAHREIQELLCEIMDLCKAEEESGIKYLNINVSNSEVERNPDIVRLCADAGVMEYVKPKTGNWIKSSNGMFAECSDCGKHGEYGLLKQYKYCPNCGAKMESEDKE